MPPPASTVRPRVLGSVGGTLTLVLVLLATLVIIQLGAPPAEATGGHRVIVQKSATCYRATDTDPWGGVVVDLKLDKHRLPRGESYLIVVESASGHELDRVSADAPRYRTKIRIVGNGLTQTPDLLITVSFGGDTLDRTRVFRNCGSLDPDPTHPPVIESVTVLGCDVFVRVANLSDETDTILVALWPEGSNVAPMRAVDLPAGSSGMVTFEAQGAGTYRAAADSATTFLSATTPFDIVVPERCASA